MHQAAAFDGSGGGGRIGMPDAVDEPADTSAEVPSESGADEVGAALLANGYVRVCAI